ncbi:hypothetical protein VNO77_16771 [Canavalia gladiata]|uniref:Uncharacterized protein n=1 Tax=Canavalia gladiata TaxID=3824 RepID=A0AAN9LHR3_CANGL
MFSRHGSKFPTTNLFSFSQTLQSDPQTTPLLEPSIVVNPINCPRLITLSYFCGSLLCFYSTQIHRNKWLRNKTEVNYPLVDKMTFITQQ